MYLMAVLSCNFFQIKIKHQPICVLVFQIKILFKYGVFFLLISNSFYLHLSRKIKRELTTMKACPKCKSASKHRMRRKGLMKLIPGTKRYACDNCNAEYTWLPVLNFSVRI